MYIDKTLIMSYLPSNPVIIDCGAHIGVDSIELSKFEGSTIYAFEAVREIYDKLIDNTRNYPNIQCFNIALGDCNGETDMFVSSGESDGSSSLLRPKEHINDHPNVFFEEIAKVKCMTLSTWVKHNNINRVDMLWLDMQGAEQKMLSASRDILKKVKLIHAEVSTKETYEGVETYPYFKRFLEKHGFRLLVKAIPTGYDMGNALFIKSS